RVLADALRARLVRGELAQLAAAGRRHGPAAPSARAALRPVGSARVPAPVPVLPARLLGPVQSRLGVPLFRGGICGDRDLVRKLAAEPAADGRDGPYAARDGGARRGRGAPLGEVRHPGPLPHQGNSRPRRVVRDAMGAASDSALDAGPYRLALPRSPRWVEADFPDVIAYKQEQLSNERPVCVLEHVGIDLTDVGRRRALFARIGTAAREVLVVTEGLLIYLTPEQ